MKVQKRCSSVKDLLCSPSFLQTLTPTERSELLRPSSTGPSSPQPTAAKSTVCSRATPWGSPLEDRTTADCMQPHDAEQQQHHSWPLEFPSATQHITADGSPSRHDKQQLLQDSIMLLEHRAQLQGQVEELQQQLAVMQKHYQHQRQQHSPPDPSHEAVIAGLRSSMAQVSTMASTVSQENKLLTAENKRLLELREQQAHALQQKQARIHQLEGSLLQQLQETSRETLQQAETTTELSAKLDALLASDLLAAVTAGQPPDCGNTSGSSVLLEELSGANNQLRPLLSEISALRRAQQGLQKQVGQLQLQLSTAERDAHAASSAAAADKALARRTITQAHQRLSAALQRLKALAERQQQQSLLLQEREAYIARLERCLVQQNAELQRLAADASASAAAAAAASNPAGKRAHRVHSSHRSANSSKTLPATVAAVMPATPTAAAAGGFGAGSAAGGEEQLVQLNDLDVRLDEAIAQLETVGSPQGRQAQPRRQQPHHQQQQQDHAGLRAEHCSSISPKQHQQQQQQSPKPHQSARSTGPSRGQQQQQQRSPSPRGTFAQRAQELLMQQHQQREQEEAEQGLQQQQQQQQQQGFDIPASSSPGASTAHASPAALAVSRAAVALQCRRIMAQSASRAAGEDDCDETDAFATADAAGPLSPAGAGAGAGLDSAGQGQTRGTGGTHNHSGSPARVSSPSRQQTRPASNSKLPSFTANAGRMHKPAGVRVQQQHCGLGSRSGSSSGGGAGAAAKCIASAAAAVAALDVPSRGLWGNTTTLGGTQRSKYSAGHTSPGQLTAQQQQQQRQRRLRELLQQKQRRPSPSPQQRQRVPAGGSCSRRSTDSDDCGEGPGCEMMPAHPGLAQDEQLCWQELQQQQQHEGGWERDEEATSESDEQKQQQQAAVEVTPVPSAGRESSFGRKQWQKPQQQQQSFGFRSVSAHGATVHVFHGNSSSSKVTPNSRSGMSQQDQHSRAESLTPAAVAARRDVTPSPPIPSSSPRLNAKQAAAAAAGAKGAVQYANPVAGVANVHDGMHAGMQKDGGKAVGDDGLLDEVMAMQANLQELESDLLQLGCGFDE